MQLDKSTRWIGGTIAALALTFAAFTLLLWRVGLLDFTGTEARAKVIASALALLGALVASMVTFVGLLLKRSLDERNLALKQQAEERLRLDTAIHAVGLLSTNSGVEAPKSQRAGALFALATLGS